MSSVKILIKTTGNLYSRFHIIKDQSTLILDPLPPPNYKQPRKGGYNQSSSAATVLWPHTRQDGL